MLIPLAGQLECLKEVEPCPPRKVCKPALNGHECASSMLGLGAGRGTKSCTVTFATCLQSTAVLGATSRMFPAYSGNGARLMVVHPVLFEKWEDCRS
jgi:hypothetical protein